MVSHASVNEDMITFFDSSMMLWLRFGDINLNFSLSQNHTLKLSFLSYIFIFYFGVFPDLCEQKLAILLAGVFRFLQEFFDHIQNRICVL